ncbi:hypothetical protein [Neisseria mucosa]|uniref:hypothetical protein n=1 Tax=Neisseria mucosa TaxID=488 RepID=UPI001CA40B6F|nr:hypothetical protein [Neisseria mucosa]
MFQTTFVNRRSSEKLLKRFKIDVGRILESDVIRVFVGYEYPTNRLKRSSEFKTPYRLSATADVVIRAFIGYKYPTYRLKRSSENLKSRPV